MLRDKSTWGSARPEWSRIEDSDLRPIQVNWRRLIARRSVREQAVHSFLAEHAQIAFGGEYGFAATISKLRLGADLVTDFVCVYDNWSNGIRYKLVEIEKPQTAPFTKEGISSSGLSRAVQQVLSWKQWLEEHGTEARRLFPSFFFQHNPRPIFQFEVIIGTRKNSEQWLDRRIALADALGISIRSFDSITPRLGSAVMFHNYSDIGDEKHKLNGEVRNKLACPFVRALTDADWRSMIRETRYASSHFMGHYGELLAQCRKENGFAGRYRKLLRHRSS